MNEVLRQLKTRILALGGKVVSGTATDDERNEYERLLSDFDRLSKTSIAAEEVETRKEDNNIKREQTKEQRKDRIFRTATVAAELIIPLAVGTVVTFTTARMDLTNVPGPLVRRLTEGFVARLTRPK